MSAIIRNPISYWRTVPRFSDQALELSRLCQNSRIKSCIKNVIPFYEKSTPFSLGHQVAYGRSIEVLETFSATHYVFNHGQSSDWLVPHNVLMAKIYLDPSISPFETLLRHPRVCRKGGSVDWYKFHLSSADVFDNDFRDHLVSADGCLCSHEQFESALFFFNQRSIRQWSYHRQKWPAILSDYIADLDLREFLMKKFQEIERNYQKEANGTVLYTICVPKHWFKDSGYVSKSLGKVFDAVVTDEQLLEIMQRDLSGIFPHPQVRLLAHKLFYPGVSVFMFPSSSDDLLIRLNERISELINVLKNN